MFEPAYEMGNLDSVEVYNSSGSSNSSSHQRKLMNEFIEKDID